jgi:hypothetical protein
MTVKLARDKNQSISAPDHPSLTIPEGDFTIGFIMRLDGVMTGEAQTILSTGNFQEAGSFQITYQPLGNTLANRIAIYRNTVSTSLVSSAAALGDAGAVFAYFVRRSGGTLGLFKCSILSSAPADGSAVVADGTVANNAMYDGARGWTIGARADKAANRSLDHSLGRIFLVPEALSTLEMSRYAYGEDIVAQLGKIVSAYVRFDTPDDIADRSANANVFTVNNGPLTASAVEPPFGYAPAATPPTINGAPEISGPATVGQAIGYTPAPHTGTPTPTRTQQWLLDGVAVAGATGATYTSVASDVGIDRLRVIQFASNGQGSPASATSEPVSVQGAATNSISVTPLDSNRIVQRGYPVRLDMAYTGKTPTALEYLLTRADGVTVAQNWTALAGASIDDGIAVADVVMPSGGPYRLSVRSRDASGILASSASPTTEVFLVGGIGAVLGSSSASRFFEGWSGSGYTPDALTRRLSASTLTWGTMSTEGAATVLAASLRQQSGVPIGLLPCGDSGTKLTDWLNTSGAQWTTFLQLLAEAGGKLEFVYITLGSNDAAAATNWSEVATHYNRMVTLADRIREVTGQPNLPILWGGSNRRTDMTQANADLLRQAENMIGDYPNVYHVQTVDFPLRTDDGVHLTAAGFLSSANRTAYVLGRKLYGDGLYARGPALGAGVFDGNRIRVPLTHRNGDNFTPAAAYTGITVADGSEALTITTEKYSATEFDIVGSRDFVAPTVSYLSGTNPDVTGSIFDNGATALPANMSPARAPVAGNLETTPPVDSTAPAWPGGAQLTASNITTSGATLTASAPATDSVGVAGYQISLNGGTSYNNIGPSPTTTVTGRPANSSVTVLMRAYDAALNYSTALARTFTTLAETPGQDDFDATKVAPARKVVFSGGTRVVVFGGPVVVYPGGPYQQDGRWTIDKHPLDEFYCVADISFDLTESQATAVLVVAVTGGVQVIEQPVLQGSLIAVKVGGLDELSGAANFCTLRVTLSNGEQIDRTIWFARLQGTWAVQKDPDDKRYFVADVTNILADSGTQIASALPAIPVGVQVLEQPVAQGALIMVKLGGMDVSADPLNHCTLPFLCANGEKFFRTIHFNRVDN